MVSKVLSRKQGIQSHFLEQVVIGPFEAARASKMNY